MAERVDLKDNLPHFVNHCFYYFIIEETSASRCFDTTSLVITVVPAKPLDRRIDLAA